MPLYNHILFHFNIENTIVFSIYNQGNSVICRYSVPKPPKMSVRMKQKYAL